MTNTKIVYDQSFRDDIIDCFTHNILGAIVYDNDFEDYETNDDDVQTIKAAFAALGYDRDQMEEVLANETKEGITGEVCTGCGEYWRDEYGIYKLQYWLMGDEFDIAMSNVRKMLGM